MEAENREFSCPTCQKTYYSASNYTRHLKMIHNTTLARIRPKTYSFECYVFKCLEGCNTSYATTNRLIDHLVLDHSLDIKTRKIEFLNFQDFNKWKAELEIENSVQYIQHNGKKVKKDTEVLHYKCNRSSFGRSDGERNGKDGRRMRGPRSKTTLKSMYCCTSHIIVTINRHTRHTQAKYIPFHYGHDLDHRLIKIPKLERIEIAKKLMQGVSISRLLEDIKNSNSEVAARISRKDLHNIKKSFKIRTLNSPLDSDDMKSLSMWVEGLSKDEDSPIALWKPPGQEQAIPSKDEVHFDWYEDDLCLIMMSKRQSTLLEQLTSGDSLIALHSVRAERLTHVGAVPSVNLFVVAAVDEWGSWLPLATLWCSRMDLEVIEAMLLVVRRMVGNDIAPRYLVTDASTDIYEVWVAAFSAPSRHLFAPWHVTSAWRQGLAKTVCSTDKRKEILGILEALRDIEDVTEFEFAMDEFLAMMEEDNTFFNDFFTVLFSGESESWAKCYQDESLRTMMDTVSSGQRSLVYELDVGQRAKRVDAAVMAVHTLVQDKMQARLNKMTGSVSGVATVGTLHNLAMEGQFEVYQVDEQYWMVRDVLGREETVTPQGEKCCDLACTNCGICYHSYCCSCPRYNMEKTICEHIHCLHVFLNNNLEWCITSIVHILYGKYDVI